MIQTMQQLWEEASHCEACALCQTRTHVVFGTGVEHTKVMLVGEGPGENEDLQGEPFVGKGGKLLDKMLAVVDLSREKNLYITNMVKCRPPKNRDPLPQETAACIGYLRKQAQIISPKIIVCLGRVAACSLISPQFRVTQDHGKWVVKGSVHMMGTFHPAALLRNPSMKPAALSDLQSLRAKNTGTLSRDL